MVLLDARMPVMDGFACCIEIQALAGGQSTPVLMITSLEDEDSVDRAFEAGATDYITKPIHWAVLRRRVQRLLQEKQAEREILKALERERELGDLRARIVTMVSHEYRTPLTAILSSAELLECYWQKWDEPKRVKHLQRIQTAAQHLTQLVSDVLSINEAESGELEFKPDRVDLGSLCVEAIAELRLGSTSRHQIVFNRSGDCADAIVDAKLLRQILTNLLSNAVKYSPKGGNIKFDLICPMSLDATISQEHLAGKTEDESELHYRASSEQRAAICALASEKVAIFRIQDSGIGILADEQGQMFNAFHRGSNVGTIQGTGLGLAIAKKAVELHRGEITLESSVGMGTTVTVTLPLNHSDVSRQ